MPALYARTFNSTKQGTCHACPKGRYISAESNVSILEKFGECDECPRGTYSPQDGASQCVSCPSGYVALEKGMEKCERCALGRRSNGTTNCMDLPAGEFGT